MANIKSAKKRIDTINRRREENKFVKATMSTYIKNFRKALESGNVADAEAKLPEIISYIDSARSKGVIHKNTASNRVARLTSALYKAKKAAPAETVAPAKKTTKKAEVKAEETTEVVAEEKPAKAKKTTTKKTEKVEKEKKTTTKKAKKVEE